MTRKEYNSCVDLYADGVFRFILKNIRDKEKARDIVQEAFARMWQKLETIASDKSKSYLFTTAYHAMIDQIRKDERIVRLDEKTHRNENIRNECQHHVKPCYKEIKKYTGKA